MKRLISLFAVAVMVVATVAPSAWAQSSVGDKVDDAMITTAVKAKLTTDRLKNAVKVNVDTKDGVVTLKGTVSTEEQRVEAERLARDTKGVKDVVTTDLKVDGSPAASPRK